MPQIPNWGCPAAELGSWVLGRVPLGLGWDRFPPGLGLITPGMGWVSQG